MKTLLLFVLLASSLCSCYNTPNAKKKTQENELDKSNEASFVKEGKPVRDLFFEAEKIIEAHAKLRNDSSTLIKLIKDSIGSNTHEIYCYYLRNRLISIENRIMDETGWDISFTMFYFDKNNSCYTIYKKENRHEKSLFYILDGNSIIVHNNQTSKLLDDSLTRSKIIQEAAAVLDSTMQLFPEFTYTFNWK
jgi:hypothetical protein